MDTNSVVKRLRSKQSSMSLRQFAKKIGCSAPYLSDIYLGRRLPGPKILAFLGITVQKKVTRAYEYKALPSAQKGN